MWGIAVAPWALRLLNTPEEVMGHAQTYMRIYFAGTIGNLIFNIGSGILRAIGDSKRPLYVLIACTCANIVLDLFLVLVIPMGVAGAGIATILSQFISAVLVLWLLARSGEDMRVHVKRIKLHPDLLARIFRIGLPAGLQSVFYSLSNMVIQSSVNSFGTNVMAGWTVYGKVDGLFWMMMNAFGIAITAFVGQNYGARQYARVKKSVRVWLAIAFGASISCPLSFTCSAGSLPACLPTTRPSFCKAATSSISWFPILSPMCALKSCPALCAARAIPCDPC